MESTRLQITVLGTLLPYLARIPNVVTDSPNWLLSAPPWVERRPAPLLFGAAFRITRFKQRA